MSSAPAVPPPSPTAEELTSSFSSKSSSPVAETERALGRIKALNPALNCFITVLADSARKSAAESAKRYIEGRSIGPLDGVPVAVKDLIYIEGVRCTAGSRILAENIAAYDAPVIRKLRAAGAVIVGTTNLHEFAAGTTSVNPHYGAVRNPWGTLHMAGGSSGGSAAAVAAGMVPVALGTDTAGSVRIPAALCGVLGLKPTYGRVSRLGVIPLAPSLDVVGVLASSTLGTAAALRAIAGHDSDDMTTVDGGSGDFVLPSDPPKRVGVVKSYFHESNAPAVEENFRGFVGRLKELGCEVREAELDGIGEVYDRWLPVRRAEATSFHIGWLEAAPQLYGEDVRALLEQGREVKAIDYVGAVNARPSYMERFSASMKDFDLLAVPCTRVPAPLIEQSAVEIGGVKVPVYSALNRLTLPFNYLGAPSLSVPSGLADGLPLGVQVVGKLFDEAGVLGLAAAYESKFGAFPHPPDPPNTP